MNGDLAQSRDVRCFDLASQTFVQVQTEMTTPRTSFQIVRMPNGRFLAIGGVNNSGLLRDCEQFDPLTHQWTTCSPMMEARARESAVLGCDGKVYVFGNGKVTGPQTAEYYDPMEERWTQLPSCPAYFHDCACASCNNGKIYFFGGTVYDEENKWSTTSKCYSFDIDTHAFSPLSDLPVPCVSGAAICM